MASSPQHEASNERMDTTPDVSNTGNVPSPRGLNTAATEWTINYFVVGDESACSIKINQDVTIDVLRERINKKLELVPRRDLTKLKLYLLDIPNGTKLAKRANEALATKGEDDVLSTIKRLSVVFPSGPKDDETIHILIKTPSPPTTPPNPSGASPKPHRSPPKDDNTIQKALEARAESLRLGIKRYLSEDLKLPLFQPQAGTDEVRNHITSLEIPVLPSSPHTPSLLLHKLGEWSHELGLADRVDKIFEGNRQKIFICNASGAGKTRLLLEGLYKNWGLYFTARPQPDGVGSSDLETILEKFGPDRLSVIPDEDPFPTLSTNREDACRQFHMILYARVYIFLVYLRCASEMPGGITEAHKGRWLLIQLVPDILPNNGDAFDDFTALLAGASTENIVTRTKMALDEVRKLLPDFPMFCVLDEAQVPANQFSEYFRSESNPKEHRPILREIIRAWKKSFPKLIISGTGVSMRAMETVLFSAVAKETTENKTETKLGAFDTEETQQRYLELYLPPGFLGTPIGQQVASRAAYWLHGRYRFTATFISHLIQTGFESPHQVLNGFVYAMTNIQPSDCEEAAPLAIQLEKPHGFDFSKLEKDPALHRQIGGYILEYMFSGESRFIGSEDDFKLVEYGVARFGLFEKILVDEPLALLAATHYFTTQTPWPLQHFLLDGISAPDSATRGKRLEHLGVYLLVEAFKSPRRLSEIFQFIDANELGEQRAQLVCIHKDGKDVIHTPFNFPSDQRGTYILGRSANTEAETLSWLQNPERTAFCFPAHTIGGDVILFLQLDDGTLLRVIIQFKYRESMGPQFTADAYRTTDPMQFISHATKPGDEKPAPQPKTRSSPAQPKETHLKNPEQTGELLTALKNLGPGSAKAGEFGVLRVLASFPAVPHAETLSQAVKDDQGRHPGATLDMTSIALAPKVVEYLQCLEKRVVQVAKERKSQTKGKSVQKDVVMQDKDKMNLDEDEDERMPAIES